MLLSEISCSYPLLVTGVGRSGTKFMQESLNAIGGDVSHDNTAIAKHGAVAWPLAVRETGHLDPLLWNGTNGYELPSFSRKAANTVVGTAPRARFEKVFHQVWWQLCMMRFWVCTCMLCSLLWTANASFTTTPKE